MRIHDVSVTLSETLPVWPGEPRVRVRETSSIVQGDAANVSHISLGVHTGTHIDAPRHFVRGGETVDEIDLRRLIGPAVVRSLPDITEITAGELEGLTLPADTKRLLLRTSNSELWHQDATTFVEDYVALTPDAARWVVRRGIDLIGIDYLSIQKYTDAEPETHRVLLGGRVVILEGLDLTGIAEGSYLLYCLPLKLMAAEGAPVRAVLIEE